MTLRRVNSFSVMVINIRFFLWRYYSKRGHFNIGETGHYYFGPTNKLRKMQIMLNS